MSPDNAHMLAMAPVIGIKLRTLAYELESACDKASDAIIASNDSQVEALLVTIRSCVRTAAGGIYEAKKLVQYIK